MQIYCRGKAKIRHAETLEVYEIDCSELDWDAVDGDDRQMGLEIHYEAVIDHPDLGTLTWGIWEYPVGIENYSDTDAGKHTVVDDFDYGLEHEMPEPDDWLSYEIPDSPCSIFMHSYQHTAGLLATHGSEREDFILNRMVFSHQVTALEAYLGDTLITEVMDDSDAMYRLISKLDELVNIKFSLTQISSTPDLVKKTVRDYLRKILYHNLSKVDNIYYIALNIKILNLSNDKPKLFRAITLRHDCVHRNGFDQDGNELNVFTKEFVQNTADLIRDFVAEIENALNARRAGTIRPSRSA